MNRLLLQISGMPLTAKNLFFSVGLLLLGSIATAQVTVTSGGGSGAPSTNYTTLAAAVTAINNAAVHSGAITCTVNDGHTETAPIGGYNITANGTSANPIVFKKSGSGVNPTFTAFTPQASGNLLDAVFKIVGGDYITIDGFTMLENNSNATTTAASNNMTEFGVALLNASTSNGPQNITIKNCTIDLNRTYTNTFGIYSNSTHTSTSATGSLSTTTGGEHQNLVITKNTITDVNTAIAVVGAVLQQYANTGLIIGGSSGNGNTITNYGTGAIASGYLNMSTMGVNGILLKNNRNIDVSYNAIASSSAAASTSIVRGIYLAGGSNTPTGALTNNISNNNISVKSVASGALFGIYVDTNNGNNLSTLNINGNDFNNFGHQVTSSGAINFIENDQLYLHSSISNNTFTNISVNSTGALTFIANGITTPSGGTKNINGNSIVTGFTRTGSSGTVTLYSDNASSTTNTTINNNNNNFSNITVSGSTAIAGWDNSDGPTSASGNIKNLNGNTFTNWTGGTGAITVLEANYSGTGSANGNTIGNITSSGVITGILMTAGTFTVSGNTIYGLSSSGSGVVTGLSAASGTNSIIGNKIYGLQNSGTSTSAGLVYGIAITGGSTNVYNNLIGDLKVTTASNVDAIRGIAVMSTATSTTHNVFHNSIYLNASSTGTNFGSTGIYHNTSTTATSGTLNLRNNIVVNNSTGKGTGRTVAFRRQNANAFVNYGATSNNNLFYAGTPGTLNLIYADGTNFDQTLDAYQARVTPRDNASVVEDTSTLFQSITGSDPNYLRLAAGTTSYAESGAVLITSPNINTDYWGVTRPFPSPTHGGTSPDIGASEFDGIPANVPCLAPAAQATSLVTGTNTAVIIAGSFTAPVVAPSGYLVVRSIGALSATPVDGTTYAAAATLGNGTVVQSSSALSFTSSSLTSNTAYTITVFSYNSADCTGGPKYLIASPLTSVLTTCPAPATAATAASGITASSATFSWTAAVVGGNAAPITYILEVSSNSGYTAHISGSPFAVTGVTETVNTLSPATTYYWRVKATNGSCESTVLTGTSFSSGCAVPNNPTDLAFTSVTATTLTLSYTAASPAPTGYTIFRSTSATPPVPVNGTSYTSGSTYFTNYLCVLNSTSLTVAQTGLVSNTHYYYYTFARNATSCTGGPVYSSGAAASQITCPASPTSAINSDISTGGFTVSWTASVAGGSAGTINYILEVYTDSGYITPVTGSPFAVGTGLSQAVTGLNAGTIYYYRVKANNGTCDSTPLAGTVTTTCAPLALNIVQGFNSATTPACWSTANVAIQTATKISYVTTASNPTVNAPQEGTHMVLYNSFSSTNGGAGSEERLISPPVITTGASSIDISFYWNNENHSLYKDLTEGVQVQYSTDNVTWTDLGSFIPRHDGSLTEGSRQWNLKTITSTAVGNLPLVYFAIKFHSEFDENMMLDNLIIKQTSTPVSITPSPAAICAGSSTTLTASSANPNYTYTWSPATGLDTTTGATVTASPTTTTTYTVSAVHGAMSTTATVLVTVNPVPASVTISPNVTVCDGTVTALTAASGASVPTTVMVGAITSTETVLQNSPYRQTAGSFSRIQHLYTKAELNAAGITGAQNITSLGFNVTTAVTGNMATYNISIANTVTTAMTTAYLTGTFTSVYNGTNVQPVLGVNTYTFTTPFAWDGNSNIVINICHAGAGTSGSTLVSGVTTVSNSTVSGTGTSICTSGGGTAYVIKPVIYLEHIVNTIADITWSPTTDLYTDAAANNAYTGTVAGTVYHKGSTGRTYTATGTLGTCTKTNTVTVTAASPVGITSVTADSNPICAGTTATLTANGVTGGNTVVNWFSGPGGTGEDFGPGLTLPNVPPGTYYARVTGDCGAPAEASLTLSAGNVAVWNGTNWTNNTPPISTSSVFITGNFTATQNINACTLTVSNNANVVIPSGFDVTLRGALSINSGTFTLQNNANLIQTSDEANFGNITVIRNSSKIKNLDYTLWSSPVKEQILLSFSPNTTASRFYRYNSATNFYNSVTSPGPAAATFEEAKGYLIRVPYNHPTQATIWEGKFTGEPNNGPFTYTMFNGGQNFRFNLVGNPYPSPISAVAFAAQNSGITKTLYFWRETNLNTDNNAYCSWSPAGGPTGTFVPNGEDEVFDLNGVIQTGQGFFVEALNNATTVNFNNSMRINNHSDRFFRNSVVANPADYESHRIWLNITNTAGVFCQTAFGYMTDATQDYDPGIEGRYMNTGVTELYSLIGSDKLVIQGRALPFATSDVVPLGFSVATSGNYTIAIDHVDGLFMEGQRIYLKDNFTGNTHDLTSGAYTFATEAGTFTSRFEVVYEPLLHVSNPVFSESDVVIYKEKGSFIIKSGTTVMDNVKVFDIRGRLLVDKKSVNATEVSFNAGETNQVLVVKITSEANQVVTKKVIN